MSDQKNKKGGAEFEGGIPWSEDSERAVLGGCLSLMDACQETLARVTVEWFYSPLHRDLWTLIQGMQLASMPIDAGSVLSRVMEVHGAAEVGYRALVLELANEYNVTTPALLEYHVKILGDKLQFRRLREIGVKAVTESSRFHENPIDVVSKLESEMFDLMAQASGEMAESRGASTIVECVEVWSADIEATCRRLGQLKGLGTGLHDFDRTFNGLDDSEGEIFTIAARPGAGKTALAVSILNHLVMEEQAPGLLYSLEMSKTQILSRLILGSECIDTSKAITGMFSKQELRQVDSSARGLAKAPLFINDSSDISTADLRAEVQVYKRKHGIRWIMIDYLALVKPSEEMGKKDERLAIVEVMKTLHFLKKQCKLVVFLLVQMNRESDRNKGAAPVMADLQGSAAIEQFSDHIVFITRPEMTTPWTRMSDDAKLRWKNDTHGPRMANPDCWSDGWKYSNTSEEWPEVRQDYEEHAVAHVKKNRRGPTPELKLRFVREWTRFLNRTPRLYSNNMNQRQA